MNIRLSRLEWKREEFFALGFNLLFGQEGVFFCGKTGARSPGPQWPDVQSRFFSNEESRAGMNGAAEEGGILYVRANVE